jgi:hypothetical protein
MDDVAPALRPLVPLDRDLCPNRLAPRSADGTGADGTNAESDRDLRPWVGGGVHASVVQARCAAGPGDEESR